jgi:aminoglycoside 2'-N-acetyltransferase I
MMRRMAENSVLTLRRCATTELTTDDVRAIRALLDAAFGDDREEAFGEDDWQHALGGTHVIATREGRIVGHAAVVEREIHVGGRPLRTGYVEAVAVLPTEQGAGVGTAVMEAVDALISSGFELGALGTGSHHFYERLRWRTWRGPSSVRTATGERRSRDEDGFILVLATPSSPTLDVDAPISCDDRPGDAW